MLVSILVFKNTGEEEHAIRTGLFVYTRFHARNIFEVIVKKQVSKHTHVFSLQVKTVEILTDLNWKWKLRQWKHLAIVSQNPVPFLYRVAKVNSVQRRENVLAVTVLCGFSLTSRMTLDDFLVDSGVSSVPIINILFVESRDFTEQQDLCPLEYQKKIFSFSDCKEGGSKYRNWSINIMYA